MTVQAPQISVSAEVRRTKRALARMGHSFGDREFAEALANRALQEIDSYFRTEANDGEPWEALKQATIDRKGSSGILKDKGRLRQAWAAQEVSNHRVVIGNNVAYAGTHQFGDEGRNIPARPMLPKPERAERMAVGLLQALVEKKKRQAGL